MMAHGATQGLARPLHVLLVEENPIDARVIRAHLGDPQLFAVTHAPCLRDALDGLSDATFDGALLDLTLPDSCGEKSSEAAR